MNGLGWKGPLKDHLLAQSPCYKQGHLTEQVAQGSSDEYKDVQREKDQEGNRPWVLSDQDQTAESCCC